MNRWIQTLIAGGAVATVLGVAMRRQRNTNMLNRVINMLMNGTMNVTGRLGGFRLIGRSKMFRNMIKAR